MREILFRGKRIDNGEWVYGGYSYEVPYMCRLSQNDESKVFIVNGCENFVVERGTVCEYTGITDRNGVKIFENDILESRYDDDHPEDVTIETVLWYGNAWCIKQGQADPEQLFEYSFLPCSTVIGNIYDNHGLIER